MFDGLKAGGYEVLGLRVRTERKRRRRRGRARGFYEGYRYVYVYLKAPSGARIERYLGPASAGPRAKKAGGKNGRVKHRVLAAARRARERIARW